MQKRSAIFGGVLLAIVCAYALLPVLTSNRFVLAAIGDITQVTLCAIITLIAVRNSLMHQRGSRLFWALLAVGYVAWTLNQGAWVYYEVVLRKDVPDPFVGDILLFFHIVPFMAALAVRPDRKVGFLRRIFAADSALILLWWLFLYIYTVLPLQYIHADLPTAAYHYNVLYMAENGLWIVLLALASVRAKGAWRKIYGSLIAPSVIGIASSQEIDIALIQHKYYTGSAYDIPLVFGLVLLIWSLIYAGNQDHTEADYVGESGQWLASFIASVVTLSLAAFAWMAHENRVNPSVANFQLKSTLIAFVVLGSIGILRYTFADRERQRLFRQASENLENLRRMQEQLIRSEKLAAVGELVGGAAHEINNPLTAILGYAELLSFEQKDAQVLSYADKIAQQARRTKEIVQNLLRFARPSDSTKKLVNLNSVVQNMITLRSMETMKGIDFKVELDPNLPLVWGDPTQLMDVCFHVIGNAADALRESTGGSVGIRTCAENGFVRLEVLDDGPGILEPRRVFDPFYTTKAVGQGTGLGLSICYGIIRNHQGEIHCENLEGRGARFVIQLPIAPANLSRNSKSSIVRN